MIFVPRPARWLLCLLSLALACAGAGTPAVDYLDFESWARAHDMSLGWRRKNSELILTNSQHRILGSIDSRKLLLDGVNVWLSAPLALRRNRPQIASIDLQTLLHPLLFPPKSPSRSPLKRIALDSGHGGKDPGNEGGKFQEKQFTLLLGTELAKLLEAAGFHVVMTRSTDSFIDLEERPRLAEKAGADLFISLHFNSTPPIRKPVTGVEVYCLTPTGAMSTNVRGDAPSAIPFPGNKQNARNVLLAFQIQKAMVHRLPVEDRGVRRARWAVLRPAEMPAVLIEAGFMSAPNELKKIADPAYRRQMAWAILEGIQAYKKIVEP